MRNRILFVVLVCLFAANAWGYDSGIYLGVGAGKFNLEVDNVADIDLGRDSVYKLFAGYRINPYVALEFDYINLGEPRRTVADVEHSSETNGYAPYLIGTLPIGNLEIFGRVGYFYYENQYKTNGVQLSEEWRGDWSYGAGAGVTLFDFLHARLEYEVFDLQNTTNANVTWLSAAIRF